MNDIHIVMNAPAPKPNEQIKTAKILEAAKHQFAKRGFDAAKLSEIAREAGVAVGTIYLRYAGKAELLGAVLSEMESGFCGAMDDPLIWSTPFPQRFEIIMSRVIGFADEEESLGPLMAMAPYGVFDSGRSGDKVRSKISDHLQDGIDKGQLRAELDSKRSAILAHGMVEAAMIDHMMNRSLPKQQIIDELVEASTRWLANI